MAFEWKIEQRASTLLFNILKAIDQDTIFLLPANVCPIVPATFLKANVEFRFVDISLKTLCIDLDLVKSEILRIKKPGLLYVRNLGIVHDTNKVFVEIKEITPSLIIIDDRCQSIIAMTDNELYSAVDATIFSTGYGKYIDLGWGGLGLINKSKIDYKSIQEDFNQLDLYNLNSGFSESILTQKKFHYQNSAWLDTNKPVIHIDSYINIIQVKNTEMKLHKELINRIYIENIPEIYIPKFDFDIHSWRFTVFCPNKNTILKKIFDNGYFASSHYASISHLFGGQRENNAESIADKTINLFNNFKITEVMALNISRIFKL